MPPQMLPARDKKNDPMTRLRKISPPALQDPIVLQKYNMKRADIALIIAQAARFTTLRKRDTMNRDYHLYYLDRIPRKR
ncbi:hypothetical protein MITSMUL_04508 [Mitsuokella multacida DSM 20544]|uniref:Uncharacterized protein n=1 Tax=Mitsuokella multacida DSM 20544 TaxID=500635 RepID=C9KMR5_9FIRM|nr:hypothetical protein MITSMUL_04508 [Mitsuokella multacida DSM 20544]